MSSSEEGAATFALLSILFCLPLSPSAAAEVSGHQRGEKETVLP